MNHLSKWSLRNCCDGRTAISKVFIQASCAVHPCGIAEAFIQPDILVPFPMQVRVEFWGGALSCIFVLCPALLA